MIVLELGKYHHTSNHAFQPKTCGRVRAGGSRRSIGVPIWSSDKSVILSVGFFPHAIAALTHRDVAELVDVTSPASAILGDDLSRICTSVAQAADPKAAFELLQDALAQRTSMSASIPLPGGADSVRAWEPAIVLEAAGPPGARSKRQTERRIKQWTGHARRGLAMYLRAEQFFEQALVAGSQEPPWSGVAHDLGFSDQSHMIRNTKRLTGFTPRALYRRLDEEPFWCYRVLGDLLAHPSRSLLGTTPCKSP